ncbi:hypothetical protein [Streptomyces sp. NPDC002619]
MSRNRKSRRYNGSWDEVRNATVTGIVSAAIRFLLDQLRELI